MDADTLPPITGFLPRCSAASVTPRTPFARPKRFRIDGDLQKARSAKGFLGLPGTGVLVPPWLPQASIINGTECELCVGSSGSDDQVTRSSGGEVNGQP